MMNMRNPGHTPGLVIMQVNLKESGTWIFTTDQYHVYENWESGIPQGWLARDHDDWVESDQMIKALQKVRVPPYLIPLVTHIFLAYSQNEKGEREKKKRNREMKKKVSCMLCVLIRQQHSVQMPRWYSVIVPIHFSHTRLLLIHICSM